VRLFLYACGARQFQIEEERLVRQAQIIARSMAG
jgi:hypothetical protein